MTNEEIINKLKSFDNMLAEINGKRKNIAPQSVKWEVASVERYKLLENLWGKVRKFFLQEGKIKDLPNGEQLFPMLSSSAANVVGDNSSYVKIYEHYCFLENMIMDAINPLLRNSEKPVLQIKEQERGKIINQCDNKEEFFETLFEKSEIKALPYGKELHKKIVQNIEKQLNGESDFDKMQYLYFSYESMILYAMNVVGVIELKQN